MAENNLRERAQRVMDALWGDRSERPRMPGERLAPEFFELASDSCFGGFWSRPELDMRSRSLCTVAQLAALGRSHELVIHLRGALHLGISRAELIEVLMQTSQYAGIPASVQALNAAADVLSEDGEAFPAEDPPVTSYFEVARSQRAYRELRPDPVPEQLIETILETATFAPSARNCQPWHFVVVQDAGVREQIAECARAAWLGFARDTTQDQSTATFKAVDRWAMEGLAEAPVMIVLCGDTRVLPLDQMSSSIYPAAQNVLLSAAALGLGSLMASLPFYAPGGRFAEILELPDPVVPLAFLPIGYPARKLGPPRREPVAAHTSRDRYGRRW